MYEKNYKNTFNEGLNATMFYKAENEIKVDMFFEELCLDTQKIEKTNGRFFFFGNGASAAFSNHMALDWSKNGGVLSLSLSDSSLLTALSNDYSFNESFVEFLKINKVSSNDLVITTSSSGNSANILKVLEFCKDNGITSLTFSGLNNDNKSIKLGDFSIYTPFKTYGMVECAHQFFHHLWLDKYMGICEWDRKDSQNMNIKNFKI